MVRNLVAADRDVDLRDGHSQLADVEPVDLEIDRLAHGGAAAPATPTAPTGRPARRRSQVVDRWIRVLGDDRRRRRNHAGHQRASHQGPRTLCEMPHHPLLRRRDRRDRHCPANLVEYVRQSRVARLQRRCRVSILASAPELEACRCSGARVSVWFHAMCSAARTRSRQPRPWPRDTAVIRRGERRKPGGRLRSRRARTAAQERAEARRERRRTTQWPARALRGDRSDARASVIATSDSTAPGFATIR